MTSGLDSKHFKIQELQNGVYAAIASDEGWAVCNAGIVDLGDHTLVFDAFCNHLAAADLNKRAEALTGKKVDYVLISHGHRDHYRGTQAFEHATIISTRKTCELARFSKEKTELAKEDGLDVFRRSIKEEFDGWKSDPATTVEDRILWDSYEQSLLQGLESYNLKPPSIGFETAMTFHGSKRTAEAITYGGGHSDSDAILFLPEERIAYLGDLFFVGYQPYIGVGNAEEFLKVLDKVEALEPKTLVPGHGPVGTARDIMPMREYVWTLQKTARGAGASEGGRKSAMDAPIPPPFDSMKWRAFWKANLESLIGKQSEN